MCGHQDIKDDGACLAFEHKKEIKPPYYILEAKHNRQAKRIVDLMETLEEKSKEIKQFKSRVDEINMYMKCLTTFIECGYKIQLDTPSFVSIKTILNKTLSQKKEGV